MLRSSHRACAEIMALIDTRAAEASTLGYPPQDLFEHAKQIVNGRETYCRRDGNSGARAEWGCWYFSEVVLLLVSRPCHLR